MQPRNQQGGLFKSVLIKTVDQKLTLLVKVKRNPNIFDFPGCWWFVLYIFHKNMIQCNPERWANLIFLQLC